MRLTIFFLFLLSMPRVIRAQDERFFRKLFTNEFSKVPDGKEKLEDKKYSYVLHTSKYLLDLNNDGRPESIVYAKHDSEDWIEIFDQKDNKIFSYRFEVKGVNSGPYKIVKKSLNRDTDVVMIFYYEGETQYTDTQSSARIYLLTIDNHDLKKMSMFKGPSFYEEYKSFKSQYHLRNYQISLVSFDNDRTKDLMLKYRGQSTIFSYSGNGKWLTFRN